MKAKLIFVVPLMLFALLTGCGANSGANQNDNKGSNHLGTKEDPYTIKEALEVIGKETSFSKEEIFIKGIVTGTPYLNTTYHSYSVYLVDEVGDKQNVQVYSATIDDKAGYDAVLEGDTIIAGGHYTYYASKNQPELAGSQDVPYPVIYKIERGKPDYSQYESEEENERETASVTIDFTEDNHDEAANWETIGKNSCYVITKGVVKIVNDPGSQYSFSPDGHYPYRFYVGTYLHMSVTSGKIKYVTFNTVNNYPFKESMPITNGRYEINGNVTKTFAKIGADTIKIHNSYYGQTKDVPVKQVRWTSLTVTYYV